MVVGEISIFKKHSTKFLWILTTIWFILDLLFSCGNKEIRVYLIEMDESEHSGWENLMKNTSDFCDFAFFHLYYYRYIPVKWNFEENPK